MCAYSVEGEQCIKESINMIGCTRLSGKGILSAHYMLYILHQYIQLMSIVLAPNPICMKRIQRKSD